MAKKKETKRVLKPKKTGNEEKDGSKEPKTPPVGAMSKKMKLQHDILEAARRYEKLRLFGEAHRCYKKIGARPDAARVKKRMMEIYPGFASKFEKEGRLEEALKLYKDMEMSEDVARIEARMLKEGRHLQLPPEIQEVHENDPDFLWRQPNVERPQFEEGVHVGSFVEDKEGETGTITPETQIRPPESIEAPSPDVTSVPVKGKNFRICPYCGEKLDLPKPPRFCPFCREAFK